MQNAVAFANNDIVTIAWSIEPRPNDCMGFALYRIDDRGAETALPAVAVFKGFQRRRGQTTEQFPLQKFYWKDPYARLVADATNNRKFRYRVVPMQGRPGHLVPMALPQMVTNVVEITSAVSQELHAYFNRGLISTQRVSRSFHGKPTAPSLLKLISQEGNALRMSLAGEMIAALTGFLDRAKASGTIYAALYELNDPELVGHLEKLGKRLKMVLSSAIATDSKTKKKSDHNEPARARLGKSAGVEWYRRMPSNHIGHNKFLVYEDGQGRPRAVLLGATNWTYTGLCAQTNNTVVIDDPALATRYRDYWKRLAADTKAAGQDSKALQGAKLRGWDHADKELTLADGSSLDSWFSPNTAKARSRSKKKPEPCPVDMAELIKRVNAAKNSILFLAFLPGTPSIANWAAAAQRMNKGLFVRGCVTTQATVDTYYYELKGMTQPDGDGRVVDAQALDKIIPKGWEKELRSAGHAIVHDKIVVIDAFSDDCVIVTGSHNLGYKASYDNDENLVMIQGNKKLATAYATHVLDVYDHFAWRYMVQKHGTKGADQSLKGTPKEWLDRYFGPDDLNKTAQLKFWMSAQHP